MLFSLLVVGFGAGFVDGRKLSGHESPDINLIEDPKALHGIDFSRAAPGPDGTVCVQVCSLIKHFLQALKNTKFTNHN